MIIITMKMGDALAYMRKRHKKQRYREWEQETQVRLQRMDYKGSLGHWKNILFLWYVENGKLGLSGGVGGRGFSRELFQKAWIELTNDHVPPAVVIPLDT